MLACELKVRLYCFGQKFFNRKLSVLLEIHFIRIEFKVCDICLAQHCVYSYSSPTAWNYFLGCLHEQYSVIYLDLRIFYINSVNHNLSDGIE